MKSIFYRRKNKEIDSKFLKEKVFCIGLNKTGTTSLSVVLKDLGYRLGNQRKGELLIDEWAKRNFKEIIELCFTADAFQDIPFSLPFTFQILDHYFPNAKFILSIRNTDEDWYNSLKNFHGKLWAKDGIGPPTTKELKEAFYIDLGRPYRNNKLLYNTPESDPYTKIILTRFYNNHIKNVKEYFRHKHNKLICINVSKKYDYQRLCQFLKKQSNKFDFPWVNKS